ncbi:MULTISPECIES: WXG100 family type VII secretion target [Thermocrispum]|uniref:WXG100 family type VII secretion target n=1 Tax=Thermocrispum TaxID=37924 RepID=UPI0004051A3C|nr:MULTISPECIES: WXG100 family type VII secretion target [Thermocrispum]
MAVNTSPDNPQPSTGDPWVQSLSFEQVGQLIQQAQPDTFYQQAEAFERARGGLQDALDDVRAQMNVLRSEWKGLSADDFTDIVSGVTGKVDYVLAMSSNYGTALRAAGDLLAEYRRIYDHLARQRTEMLSQANEKVAKQIEEFANQAARQIMDGLRTTYWQIGNALPGFDYKLPPGFDPTIVDPGANGANNLSTNGLSGRLSSQPDGSGDVHGVVGGGNGSGTGVDNRSFVPHVPNLYELSGGDRSRTGFGGNGAGRGDNGSGLDALGRGNGSGDRSGPDANGTGSGTGAAGRSGNGSGDVLGRSAADDTGVNVPAGFFAPMPRFPDGLGGRGPVTAAQNFVGGIDGLDGDRNGIGSKSSFDVTTGIDLPGVLGKSDPSDVHGVIGPFCGPLGAGNGHGTNDRRQTDPGKSDWLDLDGLYAITDALGRNQGCGPSDRLPDDLRTSTKHAPGTGGARPNGGDVHSSERRDTETPETFEFGQDDLEQIDLLSGSAGNSSDQTRTTKRVPTEILDPQVRDKVRDQIGELRNTGNGLPQGSSTQGPSGPPRTIKTTVTPPSSFAPPPPPGPTPFDREQHKTSAFAVAGDVVWQPDEDEETRLPASSPRPPADGPKPNSLQSSNTPSGPGDGSPFVPAVNQGDKGRVVHAFTPHQDPRGPVGPGVPPDPWGPVPHIPSGTGVPHVPARPDAYGPSGGHMPMAPMWFGGMGGSNPVGRVSGLNNDRPEVWSGKADDESGALGKPDKKDQEAKRRLAEDALAGRMAERLSELGEALKDRDRSGRKS